MPAAIVEYPPIIFPEAARNVFRRIAADPILARPINGQYYRQIAEYMEGFAQVPAVVSMPAGYVAPGLGPDHVHFEKFRKLLARLGPLPVSGNILLPSFETYASEIATRKEYPVKPLEHGIIDDENNKDFFVSYTARPKKILVAFSGTGEKEAKAIQGGADYVLINDVVPLNTRIAAKVLRENGFKGTILQNNDDICTRAFRENETVRSFLSKESPMTILALGASEGNLNDQQQRGWKSLLREEMNAGDHLLVGANVLHDPTNRGAYDHHAYKHFAMMDFLFHLYICRALTGFDLDALDCQIDFIKTNKSTVVEVNVINKKEQTLQYPAALGGPVTLPIGKMTTIYVRITAESEFITSHMDCGLVPEVRLQHKNDGRYALHGFVKRPHLQHIMAL